MHLLGAGLADHVDDLGRCGAANDAVVDQDDALAFDRCPVGVVLQLHAEMPDLVGRLDEGAPDIVVANDPELERQAGGLGVTDGSGDARVRNRDHDVGGCSVLGGEFGADTLSDLVHAFLFDHAVGPGEIDILEDAETRWSEREQLAAFDAVLGDDHHFAGLDIPDEGRPHDVERAAFGGQDHRAVKLAQHQGSHPQGIAHAEQHVRGHGDQRISTLHMLQRIAQAIDHARFSRLGDQVDDHLGVGGRLKQAASGDQALPKADRVGEIAVMGERKAAEGEVAEQRLDVPHAIAAGGRIAVMAERQRTRQACDHVLAAEIVARPGRALYG